MNRLELALYVITASDPSRRRDHLDVVHAALEGGADALQLREKDKGAAELYRIAVGVRELLEKSGSRCLFLVNDRLDVALACGADGVHLGQEDLPATAARGLLSRGMVLGISAGTVEEAVRAQEEGADYLGVGPVFPTPSKPDAGEPLGLEALRAICQAVTVPVVAVGGIHEGNLEGVFEAGAEGIAVISAVFSATDMLEAVRRLRRAVDSCRGRG